jgi:hypothetical protein
MPLNQVLKNPWSLKKTLTLLISVLADLSFYGVLFGFFVGLILLFFWIAGTPSVLAYADRFYIVVELLFLIMLSPIIFYKKLSKT